MQHLEWRNEGWLIDNGMVEKCRQTVQAPLHRSQNALGTRRIGTDYTSISSVTQPI
jgi:hypothetical protein